MQWEEVLGQQPAVRALEEARVDEQRDAAVAFRADDAPDGLEHLDHAGDAVGEREAVALLLIEVLAQGLALRADLGQAHADGGHAERAVQGTTDLFTKRECDPWADELGEALSAHGVAWYLSSVQYEEDTGFFHYEWVWEVLA